LVTPLPLLGNAAAAPKPPAPQLVALELKVGLLLEDMEIVVDMARTGVPVPEAIPEQAQLEQRGTKT